MNGKYVEKELEKALMIHQRAELVLKHFKRYQRKRALAFCSNINHSEFMADYFAKNGVKSICIHSDAQRKYYCERNIGIQKLEAGDVDVVFSVDMLSEGVDIKTLDLLLFLRPTESPVVFLQQIGRGLRIAEGKQDVRILDFIGNYKKVDLIPFLLGKKQENTRDIIKDLQEGKNLPLDCQVDFEFEAIDLIRSILKSRQKIDALIEEWFLQCQEESETYQIPTRMEFFNWLDDEQYQLMKRHKKHNPFKDYCRYISHRNNSSIERVFLDTNEYHFIQCIENTKMSQLYKIPVIQTFIQSGEMRNRVSIDEIVDSFIVFYSNNRNRLDILRNKSTGEPNAFTREQWKRLIINNPIKFLSKTHGDIFERVEDTFRIKLEFKQKEYRQWFVKNVQDVLDFRRNEFLDQRIEKK
jgi:type I site-specific restriction endonuclease